MKRLLVLVAAALLMATPVVAQSPNWRPPVASTLPQLEAALVPVNKEMKQAIADMFAGVNLLSTHAYDLVLDVLQGNGAGALDAIVADVANVNADLDRMQDAAAAGLAVLDSFPPEACSADYVAGVRMAFLLIGDSVASLRAASLDSANSQISAGRYLFSTYVDLLRSITVCTEA